MVTHSSKSEKQLSCFTEQLPAFTNDFRVTWNTRNIKSLFSLKAKVKHVSCGIFKDICSCVENCIGKIERNSKTRWSEHRNFKHLTEPARYLLNNKNHYFTWKILPVGHAEFYKTKIVEAFYIAELKPSLNECLQLKQLDLFGDRVT